MAANNLTVVNAPHLWGFNALATEMRLRILGYILVYPEPVSFTALPQSQSEAAEQARLYPDRHPRYRRRWSDILRLCILDRCMNDEPDAKSLMGDFSALCRVSQVTRNETRDVFFSRNKWVLHATGRFDSIAWVLCYWGVEAFQTMTNVRIELQSTGSISRFSFRAVERFVEALKDGHSLKNLEVLWLAAHHPLQTAWTASTVPHKASLDRTTSKERNSLGERGPMSNEACDQDPRTRDGFERSRSGQELKTHWFEFEGRELVLYPLCEMRGIKRARIEGTVNESWALFLEDSMTAPSGCSLGEFDCTPNDAWQQLRDSPEFINRSGLSGDYDCWDFSYH